MDFVRVGLSFAVRTGLEDSRSGPVALSSSNHGDGLGLDSSTIEGCVVQNHGHRSVSVVADHDNGVTVNGRRVDRVTWVFGKRVTDVDSIVIEQGEGQG